MAELSGLEVLALTKEIDCGLRDTYVNNIFRIGDAQIIRFRGKAGDQWLVASPTNGAWLSKKLAEREETTQFTTTLRQLLGRARFKKASQSDLDRIYILEMEADEPVRLVVELMPPGNIIVTDGRGKILGIRNEVRSPKRRLLKGGNYEPPRPSRLSPSSAGPEEMRAIVGTEKTVGQVVGKHIALPRKYVSEVLDRMGLEGGSPSSSLSGREAELSDVLQDLLAEATNSPTPCVIGLAGKEELFVVRPVKAPIIKEADSVSSLCDELLLAQVVQAEGAGSGPLAKQERELDEKAAKLERQALDFKAQAGRARELAALALKAPTLAAAVRVVEDLKLDSRKSANSAAAVASMAFDRAKELESKAVEVARAAKKLKAEKKRGPERSSGRKLLSKRERRWYEKFRWFRTSGGRLAIGGRDAATNALIIRRHMEQDDSVYHATIHGSPFFILKGGKDQTDEEILELAQATVSFSSAWKTGLGAAEAFWVHPDQVKTAAPSGEYLSRGSFAISGKKNIVSGNILELAVGDFNEGEVTAGPESSFKGRSRGYVVLRPHREKASETAKKVLNDLASLVQGFEGYTVDDILRVMPSGGGKVIRKVGPPKGKPGD